MAAKRNEESNQPELPIRGAKSESAANASPKDAKTPASAAKPSDPSQPAASKAPAPAADPAKSAPDGSAAPTGNGASNPPPTPGATGNANGDTHVLAEAVPDEVIHHRPFVPGARELELHKRVDTN